MMCHTEYTWRNYVFLLNSLSLHSVKQMIVGSNWQLETSEDLFAKCNSTRKYHTLIFPRKQICLRYRFNVLQWQSLSFGLICLSLVADPVLQSDPPICMHNGNSSWNENPTRLMHSCRCITFNSLPMTFEKANCRC